jgi:hypothetical protein
VRRWVVIVTNVCDPHKVGVLMSSVDEILSSSPLAGLRRVSPSGGGRSVAAVRLAESFADLDLAPASSLVVLSRLTSAGATDYRLDMALRWASIHQVAAIAAFGPTEWLPSVTAMDIAVRGDIALIWVPDGTELAGLVQAILREIGGGAERALGRAQEGLEVVFRAERQGADLERLRESVSRALGTTVLYQPAAAHDGGYGHHLGPAGNGARNGSAAGVVSMPVVIGAAPVGYFTAPEAHGDLGIAARLVLHAAASAAARLLDLARRAGEMPVRSRSELLAELLMSDTAINEDLLDRARQLGIPVGGWHVAVRIEAEDLAESERDEVQRFELLEAAGQVALDAVAATGGTWYLSRMARAIMLVRVTGSNPGPQAGARAARSARRALEAIGGRWLAVPCRCRVAARGPRRAPRLGRGSARRAARSQGRQQATRGRRARRGRRPADADGVVHLRHRARLGPRPARAAGEARRRAGGHRDQDARGLPR